MKGIIKKSMYASFVMVAITVLFLMTGKAKAEEVVTVVPVTEVTDMSVLVDTASKTSATMLKDIETISFKFEMTKPGYAYISAVHNVSSDSYWGQLNGGIYYDQGCTNSIINGTLENMKRGTSVSNHSYLEAGVYYIKFTRENEYGYDKTAKIDGSVSVSVYGQYIDRTNANGVVPSSYTNASNFEVGQNVVGFFSGTMRKQYYKFTLATDAKVDIKTKYNKVFSNTSKVAFDTILYTSEQTKIGNFVGSKEFDTMTIGTYNLKSGTYYIVLDGAYYGGGTYGQTFLSVSSQPLDITAPQEPKVTYYKTNGTIVKGTGEANTTVCVKVGTSTYEGTVNEFGFFSVTTRKLLKGYKVAVSLKDTAGNVSRTKTVTVKAVFKLSKLTKYKKGTRYVEGKATKGETVYVKIGSKTYKAKVSSKSTFKVKTTKLTKGKKIYIYLKDGVGNKSKTKTYKVK